MLLVNRSEDTEILKMLKKLSFDPQNAVQLLENSIKDFESGQIPPGNKSSFLTNLSIFIEKLLKRKYSKLNSEVSDLVFNFLINLLNFCQTEQETCPIEKLSVLNSILDSSHAFYSLSKNSFSQTDEFKERLKAFNYPHLSFFTFSQFNNYYTYMLIFFIQTQKIMDFSKFTGTKLLFDIILSTIEILRSVKQVLPQVVFNEISRNLLDSVVSLVGNLKNDDLRFVQKEALKSFFNRFEDFCRSCQSVDEAYKTLEFLELEVAYNLLECQFLDKKFIGAEELNRKMWQIKRKDDLKSSNASYLNLGDKPCKHLTVSLFAQWFNDRNLLFSIYTGSSHTEIVKKFTDILKYLYSNGYVPQEILSIIWDNSFTKHQSDKEVHLGVIYDLMFSLNEVDLKFIIKKIERLDPKLVDFHVLRILKQFNFLNHKLTPNIFLVPKEGIYEVFAHLEILWNLTREEVLNEGITKDVYSKAISYLSDCMKSSNSRPARLIYAEKCIKALETAENPANFIEVLKSVLDSYPSTQVQDTESKLNILDKIEKNLSQALFTNIIQSKKSLLQDSPISFKTFQEKLNPIFSFVKYLAKIQAKIISSDRLDKLWTVFVVNGLSSEESDLYFQFLSSLVTDQPVINESQILEIYSRFLLRLSPQDMTKMSFKCFEKYFLKVNKMYNRVVLDNSDFLISVKNKALISLDHLWELVLSCTNEVVFDESGFLLKRIHRSVENFTINEQKDFISKCFDQLRLASIQVTEENLNKVIKCIHIILDFFKYCENSVRIVPMQTQQQNFELKVKVKYYFYKGNTQGTIFEDFYNTTPWASTKEIIAQRLGKDLNQLSFSVDNKIVWGDNHKTLEDLNIDKFLEIEVNESDNSSSFDEHFAQLKSIFEYYEDDIIRLALQKEGNSLDEAVSLLTSEDAVASLRSEICDKGMQVDVIDHKVEYLKKKPEILQFVAQNEGFCKVLEKLGKVEDSRVLGKVMELFEKLPDSKTMKVKVKKFAEIGVDEILDRTCRVGLWRRLKIIIKILRNKKIEGWINNFFEYGGVLIITEMLNMSDLSTCFNIECLRLQIDILSFYLKNYFTDSFLSIEELINLPELSQSLVKVISFTISSNHVHESLLESALTLLMSLPNQGLLQAIYTDQVFKQLALNLLPNSSQDSLRQKIVETVRTLIISLGAECAQYFWNLLSNGIPTELSPRCKEFFSALVMVLETRPEISQDFIDKSIKFVVNRQVNEDLQEDFLLTGYLNLLERLLKDYKNPNEQRLIQFIFAALFELNTLNDFGKDSQSLPLLKKTGTRKAGLSLLTLLIHKFPEDSLGVKSSIAQQHTVNKLQKIYNKENQPKASSGFVGLRNFGCTCYLNSVLQQLFMIQQFQKGILFSELPETENLEDNIVYQLKIIMGNLKFSKKQCFEPLEFCKAFKDFEGQSINVKVQQDADEFLNLLFDKVEETLKTNNKNFLRSAIGGSLVHEITSTDPNFPYKGTREEHFFRVSLDINNLKTLQAALDQYICPEVLDGENKYYCEEFNTKVSATKRCMLGSLCNTIFIHLKRFEFKYLEMKREKINDKFEFPIELNLRNWCNDDSQSEEYYEFVLTGVVIHSGSADSGHYFSLIKDREKLKWFRFDDRYVQDYNFEDLQHDCFGKEQGFGFGFEFESMANAYILVYERKKFLDVELEITEQGAEGEKKIMKEVVEENIEFLQDLMYFEEGYLEFLIDFLRIEENFEDYGKCESEFTYGKVLDLEEVREVKFVGQLKEILKTKVWGPLKVDQFYIRSLKSAFIFAFEVLIKAEKPDWFIKIAIIVFDKIKQHPNSILWVLDLFTFNRALLFSSMNLIKQENIKELIIEFLMDLINLSLINELNLLSDKQIFILNTLESTNESEPIDLVIELIYKSPTSRFIEYLLNAGINCFKGFYNIELILSSTIEKLSIIPQLSELFITNSSLSYLVNLYNSPTTKDLNQILSAVNNLLTTIIGNPSFNISSCKDWEFTQSYWFTEFILKNIDYFKDSIPYLAKNNSKIAQLLIEGSCENFTKKSNLIERWNILKFIEQILLVNEEHKISILRNFFNFKFGSFNKVSFFEDIILSMHYNATTKALIVVWWGQMMKDDVVSSVSRENLKVFIGVKNLNIDRNLVNRLEIIGLKDPDKLFEEGKKLVNLLFE